MMAPTTSAWAKRVTATDWASVQAGLDSVGCALTGPLLTPKETKAIAALYIDDSRFRSTINMSRYDSVRASTATSPNRSRTRSPN